MLIPKAYADFEFYERKEAYMDIYNRTSLAFKADIPDRTQDGAADRVSVRPAVIDLPLDDAFLAGPLGVAEEAAPDDTVGTEADRDALCVAAGSVADELVKCIRDTGHVDIHRISKAARVTVSEAIDSLKGAIYCNPDIWGGDRTQGWETADEYLSGNLRYKLAKARIASKLYKGTTFRDNVKALEAIMPPELAEEDVYVTLGSPWLPEDIIDDFVNYLVQPHTFDRCRDTKHDTETGSWEIPDKGRYGRYVRNVSTFGTKRIDAVHIIERSLNMKTIRITDEVSSTTTKSGKARVINREETAAAQEKQRLIIAEFRRWIWQDAERKRRIMKIFETRYACIAARRFDGRFLEFPGMADDAELFPYQKDAVARILFTPNTLLAHDVGAGKTYIMIAAAMELKRLEMAERSMFVVPNNLVGQWFSIFMSLYPDAKVLCIEPKDFTEDKRNKTLGRIISENWDGIIIACSCFDRIPLSRKFYIDELMAEKEALLKIKSKKKKVTPKFNRRLEKITGELGDLAVSDDPARRFICFDDLGIDRLFVDEAHNYKNISIDTSIFGIFGINSKGSAKCDSMLSKVHHVQKTHCGGGVVMATGTPITNSVSDIFVFQQYLQSGELELLGLQTFDSWVGMFAEKTTEFEIAVDTNSYRLATRFSRFHNIPELTNILASIADFHSIDSGEGIPVFKGYTDVVVPRSYELKAYLEEISRRADKVHNRKVKREEDNMLKITGDGRRAALDIRLVADAGKDGSRQSNVFDSWSIGRCKASECSEIVARIWHATRDDRLAQLIFCDTSTPKAGFNMYDEIRRRLVEFGVTDAEIAYIHDATTDARREKLFRNVREGRIRVLIGSTFKLGLGVNVQDRLIAIHHLDLPWRPADMVQREGRILRAGNMNEEVRIYRYITEGSFDAYSWQLLETKQRFITDILSGTVSGRSGSEVDDTVLNYAEVKALALGNPLLKSRVETRNEITRLAALKRKGIEARLRLERRYRELPDEIAAKELELRTCIADAAYVRSQGSNLYRGRTAADKRRIAAWRKYLRDKLAVVLQDNVMKPVERANFDYRGFMVVAPAGMEAEYPYLWLVREGRYRVDLGDKDAGIMIRIDNFLDKLADRAKVVGRQLDILRQELAETEQELLKEVDYTEQMDALGRKLDEIDARIASGEVKRRNS